MLAASVLFLPGETERTGIWLRHVITTAFSVVSYSNYIYVIALNTSDILLLFLSHHLSHISLSWDYHTRQWCAWYLWQNDVMIYCPLYLRVPCHIYHTSNSHTLLIWSAIHTLFWPAIQTWKNIHHHHHYYVLEIVNCITISSALPLKSEGSEKSGLCVTFIRNRIQPLLNLLIC